MKKTILSLTLILITVLAVTAAAFALVGFTDRQSFRETSTPTVRYSSASALTEDGWLYVMDYYDYGSSVPEDIIDVYNFQCVDLRYIDESCEISSIDSPYLVYAAARTSTNRGLETTNLASDMHQINNVILTKNQSPKELLALDPAELDFSFIDKELFFSLLKEALTKEPVKMCDDQSHLDGYAYGPALLTESEFANGYRFQVAYSNTVLACATDGCVQHLYIDVQYETADGYLLLSELVKQGLATDAQVGLYDQLCAISNAIVTTDDYTADAENYGNLTVNGVDLGRLAPMLASISELHM